MSGGHPIVAEAVMMLVEYYSTVYLSPQTSMVPSSPNTKLAGFLVLYLKHSF